MILSLKKNSAVQNVNNNEMLKYELNYNIFESKTKQYTQSNLFITLFIITWFWIQHGLKIIMYIKV